MVKYINYVVDIEYSCGSIVGKGIFIVKIKEGIFIKYLYNNRRRRINMDNNGQIKINKDAWFNYHIKDGNKLQIYLYNHGKEILSQRIMNCQGKSFDQDSLDAMIDKWTKLCKIAVMPIRKAIKIIDNKLDMV